MKTVQINALSGLRNDVSTERFGPGDLLSGKNVDIDETGKVMRRHGRSQVSATPTSSVWADGETMLYVQNGRLYRRLDNGTAVQLYDGIGMDVSYEAVNDRVYMSDGQKSFVLADDKLRPWGLEVPPKTFQLSSAPGDLSAGTYGVTIVYLRDGMESGAPRSQYIELAANRAIRIQNLPVPTDASITHKRIYMTSANGEAHYAVALLPAADTSITIFDLPATSIVLRTQFKTPAPAGHIVGHFNGRNFVAAGNTLFWTDPLEYELFDLRENFVSFSSQIQIFAPVMEGAFLATETETIFLRGRNPAEWEVVKAAPYGAVRGTLVTPPNNQIGKDGVQGAVALWISTRGVCIGTSEGQLENLTGNRFVMPAARIGAGLFKVRGGTPQYLVSLYS